MSTMRVAVVVLTLLLAGLGPGCGGRPPIPKRGVVESDLGGWKFRRYQPVLDVEVYVGANPAEAYTASYVRDEAEKRGRIEDADLVNVFVTRYQKAPGVLRETVRFARRLAQEAGYTVEEGKVGGVRALTITGNGEAWVMWAASRHVVKVGGRGRDGVPAGMVEAYGDRYPSVLPSGVLEGALPEPELEAGEGKPVEDDPKAPYDPDNPQADVGDVNTDKLDQQIEDKKRRDEEQRKADEAELERQDAERKKKKR